MRASCYNVSQRTSPLGMPNVACIQARVTRHLPAWFGSLDMGVGARGADNGGKGATNSSVRAQHAPA
jgi:hypothetical protein